MTPQRRCRGRLQAECADALDSLSPIRQAQSVCVRISCGPVRRNRRHKRRGRALASGFETAEAAFEEQQWDGRLAVVVGVCVECPDASEDEKVVAHRVDGFD